MNNLFLFIALILFVGCSNKGNNNVAKKTIDQNWLDSVISKADSSYTKPYKRADFVTAEFYIDNKDLSVCQIMKNATGKIKQIIIAKKNIRTFFKQCYDNGQIKTDFNFDEYGQYQDTAIYYYENGSIESIGMYQHGLKNGEWKYFDENGNQVSTDKFDNNGQVVERSK